MLGDLTEQQDAITEDIDGFEAHVVDDYAVNMLLSDRFVVEAVYALTPECECNDLVHTTLESMELEALAAEG